MLKLILLAAGYLSGSVLYGEIFTRKLKNVDIRETSRDGNPGTANAFMQGGFWCGLLTILCELAKGAVPVACYLKHFPVWNMTTAVMLLMPVLGHAFPLFSDFRGGKAIAVSFGVLLGILPNYHAVVLLAFFYILLSALRVKPHRIRSIAAYGALCISILAAAENRYIIPAVWMISAVVILKHCELWRREQSEQLERSRE